MECEKLGVRMRKNGKMRLKKNGNKEKRTHTHTHTYPQHTHSQIGWMREDSRKNAIMTREEPTT